MTDDDQAEAIAFLATAAARAGGPADRIDTHAAILFLAGDRVWKLKRAVAYPYLDFSTPARRHEACAAELRLNRRTAPQLYRAVRPIGRRADGTLGFDTGDPIDWVVEMERFPADALLLNVAARGGLTDAVAAALADRVADFHAALAPVPVPDGAARLGTVIAGNRRSMADLPPGILDPADVEALATESLAALDRLAPLLDRRGQEGWVRHGHGDLHMGNICLIDGAPLLFDCLEFDPALATTDLLYDLAFLLMDLWHRRYGAAASILLNRYGDRMDERDGLVALPLMLSVRAAVRAHVEGATAHHAGGGHRAAARAYLAFALRLLRPHRPRLIAIGGLSGTGKSTLARALAPLAAPPPGARVLRTDAIRKQQAGVALEQRLPQSAYTPESARSVYQRLVDDARALVAGGISVIADGVFADPGERAAIEAAAGGQPFCGLWLEAPAPVLRQRVAVRSGDASDATPDVVDQQQALAVGDLAGWWRLDAGSTVAGLASTVLDRIGKVP